MFIIGLMEDFDFWVYHLGQALDLLDLVYDSPWLHGQAFYNSYDLNNVLFYKIF